MKKLFLIYHYFIYRLHASNEHGVHSPFVFDLLTQVIYNKTEYYAYREIEQLRETFYESKKTIDCIDLGAGSHQSKSIRKKVQQLVRYSVKPPKYGQLLFRLVNHFQPSSVLELGTSLGITAAYISKANNNSKFTTIEGCEAIADIAQQTFTELNLKNINQVTGNFDDVLPNLLTQTARVDFVFFDGNHRKEATLNYFNQCLEKANEETVFVFDDIYWSKEMKEAWEEIKNNKRVTVTIDLFFMGIVFFRKEQVKQHFVIKF